LHVKLAAEPLCGLLQQNQVQSTPDSILPREKHFAAEKITDQPSAYPRAAERDIHVGQTTRHSMRPRKTLRRECFKYSSTSSLMSRVADDVTIATSTQRLARSGLNQH